MAQNRITVTFTPCTPTPANGYKILYRVLGTSGAYRDGGNFTTSPAVIDDVNDAADTQYEGIIKGDCGGGNYGPNVGFAATTS